jgi:hypothetical protein
MNYRSYKIILWLGDIQLRNKIYKFPLAFIHRVLSARVALDVDY